MEKKHILLLREIVMTALAFLLPLITLIILFANNEIALFSYTNKTIISFDMQSQYICYMRDFRNALLNHESLVYSTEKVFGGDYLSIYTFYLSSPFNFLVIFFKEEALPLFFAWTSILKMSIASLNFYLLVRFYNHQFSYKKIIFAIGYGLISYSFVYISNYMWLDGVMILPLVVLGLYFLEQKKHLWLYPVAIAYSLMTSWYIGFMIAVFAVVFFIYLFVTTFNKENLSFAKLLFRFFVFSLVGGLISAVYWLTAAFHFDGTKAIAQIPNNEFFSLSMVLSGLLENSYPQMNLISQNQNFITMFVGSVPLVYFVLYFFNKEYAWKNRLGLLCIVLFYLFCSWNNVLTALLHGAREPTWFPGRYSFVIGFMVAFIATLSIEEAHKLHPLKYAIPLVAAAIVLLIVLTTKHSERLEKYPLSGGSLVIYLLTVFVGFSVSFFYQRRNEFKNQVFVDKILPNALLILLVVQVISSYRGGNNVFNTNAHYLQSYDTYLKDDRYSASINKIKKYDNATFNSAFYRMEMTFNRPGNYNLVNNNPMFYSYNGLSNFSSTSKKDADYFMKKLGFHYNYFFNKYDHGSTYSINSLLGIKYLVEDEEASQNLHPYFLNYETFERIKSLEDDGINYYYNPRAIGLGFMSDKTSSYFINEGDRNAETDNVYWYDRLEYQNAIFGTFDRSINQKIFKPLEQVSFITPLDYEEDEFGIKTYLNVKKGNKVTITYSLPGEGKNMPVYFGEKNNFEQATFELNDEIMDVNNYWHNGIASVPESEIDMYTLIIRFDQDFDKVTLRPELYYEDLSVSKLYLDSLKNQEFVVDKISGSLTSKSYVGHINVTNNNKDLIFTLPIENNIKVLIDGKKQETFTKFNIFTAVSLEGLSNGTHNVTIKYQDTGLSVALPITIVSLLGIAPLIIFYNKVENFVFFKHKQEEIAGE